MLREIYRILILPFTLILLYLMFFGFGRFVMDDNIVHVKPFISTVEFAEHCLQWSNPVALFINVAGNVVMFVPFGFLGWVFPKFQNFKTLMIAFLSALIIAEAFQYFTRLGVFDVDDIILNSFGVYLGFLLKNFIEKRFENEKPSLAKRL